MPIPVIECAGTPREMGRQFGEATRESARAMVESRLQLAERAAGRLDVPRDRQWCLDLAAETVPALEQYSPPVFEEFAGIAEATGLSLPELVIGNGWTDFKDLISARGASHNCTSIAAGAPLTADGHTYIAQTWDMNVTAAPHLVVVRRHPSDGPRTLTLTTAGPTSPATRTKVSSRSDARTFAYRLRPPQQHATIARTSTGIFFIIVQKSEDRSQTAAS